MNTHDIDIELPEHDCLYETTNESGFIDVEPAYRKSTVLRLIEADRKRRGISNDKSTVLRLIEADRKRRGISNDCEPVGDMSQGCDVPLADPQQVVPLTDERIKLIWEETMARMGAGGDPVLWVARAIERAHGISTPQPAEPVNNKASNRKELLLSWVLQQCGARRYEGGAYFDNFSLSRLRYVIGELDEKATQPAEPDRGEPVGYINPEHIGQGHGSGIFWKADQNFSTPVYVRPQSAESVHKTHCDNELSSWSDEDFIRIFHERPDLANRLRKILAEPVKEEIFSAARDAGYSFAKGADGVIRMIPLIKGEAHPYDPKKPTEQEWKILTENGRKAWGDKSTESVKIDVDALAQERADFEAWFKESDHYLSKVDLYLMPDGRYEDDVEVVWEAYRAGRAALQAQVREDAERYRWLCDKIVGTTKLPCAIERIIAGDVYVADGKAGIDEAIDHARRSEGGGE